MMHGVVFAKQDPMSMWLKLFIIKLNESKFTNVPWQKGAPFFVTMLPAKEKTLSDVTDEGRQDKYDSAR